jgi:outer membrane murein-binding lipoprotein Lpp
MDYKELVENLKEWHRTICKTCGDDILTCDDLCGCTGDCIVVQAITAINDLLAENQALRNAANGFKKQAEAAEARAENAEREKNYAIELLRGICYACRNYSAHCHKGKCNNCKWDRTYDYEPNGNEDNWEWCGLKEE